MMVPGPAQGEQSCNDMRGSYFQNRILRGGFMRLAVATGLAFFICSTAVYAQQTLTGKYTGTFIMKTRYGDQTAGITLEITSAENGKLKGAANRLASGQAGQGCAGDYPLEGEYEGNNLELRGVGGRSGDCKMTLRLVAEGNKLKGKMGQVDIEVSK